MTRILFFGDSAWAANGLRRLVAEGLEVLSVVVRANPTGPELTEGAEEMRLPVLQPTKVNDPEFVSRVKEIQPDLNVSVSYDQILQKAILDSAPLGFVNFHAGKLPYYRGRNVINWAIINGETEIGLTAHYVDEGIDTGDIILQHTLPIEWQDTYGDVLGKVESAFPDLVSAAVSLVASGQATRQRQAHLPGTYFSRRGKGDEWLDWSDTSLSIYNKVRAIARPGPGARTLLGDQTVIIWRAFYDPLWPKYVAIPGEVVGSCRGVGLLVKTGDSTILVQEVQVGDNAAGRPRWRIGTRLGINLLDYLHRIEARVKNIQRTVESFEVGEEVRT